MGRSLQEDGPLADVNFEGLRSSSEIAVRLRHIEESMDLGTCVVVVVAVVLVGCGDAKL